MPYHDEEITLTEDEAQEANKKHLDTFEKWLKGKGLSAKTISKHVQNVEFYIVEFLPYYSPQPIESGCYFSGEFLGDFIIRKTAWASCAEIKSHAASIKKFYQCMLEFGEVSAEDYSELCEEIKEQMEDWLEAMRRDDEALADYL